MQKDVNCLKNINYIIYYYIDIIMNYIKQLDELKIKYKDVVNRPDAHLDEEAKKHIKFLIVNSKRNTNKNINLYSLDSTNMIDNLKNIINNNVTTSNDIIHDYMYEIEKRLKYLQHPKEYDRLNKLQDIINDKKNLIEKFNKEVRVLNIYLYILIILAIFTIICGVLGGIYKSSGWWITFGFSITFTITTGIYYFNALFDSKNAKRLKKEIEHDKLELDEINKIIKR